ncbi:pentapeptide repeat-containing protein [[Clostridium] innocuum]|uniref:pentapeptide repeat-containing protein n=1 Tax=Clostridium innocuum TaxID=1522 RepID=UPI0021471DB6|nr:pentapeptide repeat-containing protein [[Clostridium] innocuum]MCR0287590.1 pentapeptide repeat-containing protein [[Clostridium] innocuum]MCR0387897.1 pentapeptide repeat-containing protein [[Clostridium] innocuum]
MDEEQIKRFIQTNSEISLTDFFKSLERQQREVGYSMQKASLIFTQRQIIELEGKKSCKIFTSYFENCEFMNMELMDTARYDQRILEGDIFKGCTFTNCKNIASMNACTFIDCNFNACDFKHTSFIRCTFENTNAGDCDFRMANFSLSDHEKLHVEYENCKVEDSLLQVQISEDEKKQIGDPVKADISLNILECSLKLLYDSMRLNNDAQMTLDPIAHDLNTYIQMTRKAMESEGIREREETEILTDLEVHEAWANQICRRTEEMPSIDWTKSNYSRMNLKNRNLSGIDFTGSLMKNCDFTSCNLTGVDFSGCNLTGAIFLNAILAQNTFDGAKLEDIKIDQKNLQLFENAGIAVNTDQTGPATISVNRSVLSRKGNTAV